MSGPHDRFIRYVFGPPERAAAELRVVLPGQLVARVEWSSLKRELASVVDPKLRLTESDLVFSARQRDSRVPVLFVLEHQSRVDRGMAVRVERYVSRLREHWREQHPRSTQPPAVIAVVLYHGREGPWRAARGLEQLQGWPQELLRNEEVRRLLATPEYALDDLTVWNAKELAARPGPPLVRLALVLLRYGRTRELNRRLMEWVPLFKQAWECASGWEDLNAAVYYLRAVGNRATDAVVRRVLRYFMEEKRAEELMQTVGERLIAQGRAEGLAKGRAEGLAKGLAKGRAEWLLRILAARGIPVDAKARRRIRACTDLATLDRWFERALNATRLSEVLE